MNVVDTIAKREQEIIKFISENKKITAKEIALKLALTQRTVQRYLKKNAGERIDSTDRNR